MARAAAYVRLRPGAGGRKLLFVVNVLWFFRSHRLALALEAKRHGYDVHVAAGGATAAEIAELEALGLRVHPLRLQRSDRGVTANLLLVWALWRLYREVRPDIVHHVTIKPVMLGTFAARCAKIPAVVNAVSGMGYAFTQATRSRRLLRNILALGYRFCLRHPRMLFIFQNEADQAELAAVAGLDRARSVIIRGSGVDLDIFRVAPEPPESPSVTIVLPARMLRDKGVVEYAQAIAMLRDRGLRVEGLLAGGVDPDNPAAMNEAELRELERKTGVRWIGHCDDMAALFRDAHIVCLPSYREGLPKALIEAAAAARPLVTTDVPGCRDVVDDGVEGFVVAVREVLPLADALQRLVCDASLRVRMGAAARHRAVQEFSLDRVVDKMLAAYQSLLS